MLRSSPPPASSPRRWIAAFVLVALVFAVAGAWQYYAETDAIVQSEHEALEAVTALKNQQIQLWRHERLADVGLLARDPATVAAASAPLAASAGGSRSPDMERRLRARLSEYCRAMLVTPLGDVRISVGDCADDMPSAARNAIAAALSRRGPVLSDLFSDATGNVRIDAVAAVDDDSGMATGAVVLRSMAGRYLFPAMAWSPSRDPTAETLMVQRDGDTLLYLNEGRHHLQRTWPLRESLARTDMPVVRAALGEEGQAIGRDARGEEVLAEMRRVPGSPWILVTKTEMRRIRGAARSRAAFVALTAAGMILLAAAATAYLYRRRQSRLYFELYLSERRRATDLSERQRAVDAQARLAAIVEATTHLVGMAEASGRLLYANAAGRELLAVPPGTDITSLSIADVLSGPDHVVWREGIPTAIRDGRWCGEAELRAFDGRRVTVLQTILAHKAADGTVAFLSTLAHDVTTERATEQLLRLQGAALAAAANGIVITDRAGSIVWTNPGFTAITGYTAAEAAGRSPGELLRSGAHDREFYQQMWSTVLAGQVWRGEMINRRKDGTHYPERQTISPLRTPAGAISHFIGIKEDLTVEHRLEHQFRQSQKMEVVGRLAGGIAHDFNNLLTVINMSADMLVDELGPASSLRDDALQIVEAGKRAAALTRQLLAFSRKQVLKPEVLDLGSLASGMQQMLQRLIGVEIALDVVAAPAAGQVRADAGQLEQVIMNLVVNARDAMPDGGRLTIAVDEAEIAADQSTDELPAGVYSTICVSDTGVGMDVETRSHIFEPFFSTKAPGQGTGLGLSTVYGIVKQSGGAITVASEPGRGAAFRVFLPRLASGLAGAQASQERHHRAPAGQA